MIGTPELYVLWSFDRVVEQTSIASLTWFVFVEWPCQDADIAINIGRRLVRRCGRRRRIGIGSGSKGRRCGFIYNFARWSTPISQGAREAATG